MHEHFAYDMWREWLNVGNREGLAAGWSAGTFEMSTILTVVGKNLNRKQFAS